MSTVGVAKCLLCCVGIVYNLGLGVYLANLFFSDCPCISVCAICASEMLGDFQKWLESLWSIWSLDTHLSTYVNLA